MHLLTMLFYYNSQLNENIDKSILSNRQNGTVDVHGFCHICSSLPSSPFLTETCFRRLFWLKIILFAMFEYQIFIVVFSAAYLLT